MFYLQKKKISLETSFEVENPSLRQEQQSDEISVEKFMKDLRISGKYFVGSLPRREYITSHSEEIEDYLSDLEKTNFDDASILREYIRINLKYSKKAPDFFEKADYRDIVGKSKTPKCKRSPITLYSHKPRKRVERYIGAAILLAAIPVAFYIGSICKEKIESSVSPYVQKIYQLYYEIDNPNSVNSAILHSKK